MLSPDDARLVQRDRELPGLAHVLDPDLFQEWLQPHVLPQRIDRVRPRYTRYKPGTSCLVAYDVDWTGGSTVVTAKAFRPPAADKLAKYTRWHERRTALGPAVIVSAELARAAVVFPCDPKMRALAKVMGEARSHVLGALLPVGETMPALTLLSYKPERRLVARWTGAHGDAVVRVYTHGEYATVSRGLPHSIDGLRIARAIAYHPRHPVMVTDWIHGEDGTIAFRMVDRAAAVGEALACFHQAGVRAGALRSCADQRRDLALVSGALANLMPRQAPRLMHLSRTLCDVIGNTPGPLTLTHGDFAARQVVFTREGVAVTDLDAAAVADPATDLGSFLADIDLRVACDGVDCPSAQNMAERFLDGYRSVRELPDGVDIYHAVHLLRVAPMPFRTRLAEWRSRAELLLDRCEDVTSRLRRRRELPRGAGGDIASMASDAVNDPAMPWLHEAVDPEHVTHLFRSLPWMCEAAAVASARVRRHRAGRRCLIEYTLSGDAPRVFGKTRARGVDQRTAALVQTLRSNGFGEANPDGIEVPQCLGIVPSLRMWLQTGVEGEPVASFLASGAIDIAERLVDTVLKLQRQGPTPARTHTLVDESEILRQRLNALTARRPDARDELARITEGCQRLAAQIADVPLVPAHRDFYPEQVLFDGSRLLLLDLDLYALAHPALDIGNCVAHLIERATQNPDEAASLDAACDVMHDRLASSLGAEARDAIGALTTLTLARLIEIDDRLAHRRHLVEPLMEMCARRLAAARAWPKSESRITIESGPRRRDADGRDAVRNADAGSGSSATAGQ